MLEAQIHRKITPTENEISWDYEAHQGNEPIGRLNCSYDTRTAEWTIIFVSSQRPNFAQALVGQFASDIGPGQRVTTSWVKERHTVNQLKDLIPLPASPNTDVVELSDPTILQVRVLTEGGLHVDKVSIHPQDQYHRHSQLGPVFIYSHT